jgi:urea transport system permease protein
MQRFMKSPLGSGGQVLAVGLMLALIAFAFGGGSGVNQATVWMVFGLFAVSVDLMWGYCGLLSFGQAAFFGLGAFCYTWLTTDALGIRVASNGSILGLLLAIFLPGLLALFIGYFLFYGRVVGAYFTIVTLALSFLMQSLGQGLSNVFGGFTGIPNVPGLRLDLGFTTLSAQGTYAGFAVITVIAAVVVLLLRRMLSTPFGLTVDGVRDNEERLTFLGSRTVQTKLVIFVVSSAIAGLAGALFAAQSNYVASDLMGTLLSTEAVVWVAVGGRRTLVGALIGAIVVRGVGFWLSGVAIDYWNLFLGVLFIAMVLAGSTGLTGLGKWVWHSGRRAVERRAGRLVVGNR